MGDIDVRRGIVVGALEHLLMLDDPDQHPDQQEETGRKQTDLDS